MKKIKAPFTIFFFGAYQLFYLQFVCMFLCFSFFSWRECRLFLFLVTQGKQECFKIFHFHPRHTPFLLSSPFTPESVLPYSHSWVVVEYWINSVFLWTSSWMVSNPYNHSDNGMKTNLSLRGSLFLHNITMFSFFNFFQLKFMIIFMLIHTPDVVFVRYFMISVNVS